MRNVLVAIIAGFVAMSAWADPPPPPEDFAAAKYEQQCNTHQLTIYFGANTIEISPFARAAIESVIDQIGNCAVTAIQTTTVSGDAKANSDLLELSEARSENVLEAIVSAGVWSSSVQTDIVLTRSTNRSDFALEPIAGRVEVKFQTEVPISS